MSVSGDAALDRVLTPTLLCSDLSPVVRARALRRIQSRMIHMRDVGLIKCVLGENVYRVPVQSCSLVCVDAFRTK